MVTLIDNIGLDSEERKWYETLIGTHNAEPVIARWIDLEDITKKIENELADDDFLVLVATGGIEAADTIVDSRNCSVFRSPNLSRANKAAQKLNLAAYKELMKNPLRYHSKAVGNLMKHLSRYSISRITVIEGDIGNTGMSLNRLLALEKALSSHYETRTIIGAAPSCSTYSLPGAGIMLNFPPHFLKITESRDAYIRRASEVMGVEKRALLKKDMSKLKRYYKSRGIPRKIFSEYLHWYRNLTLKKLDRTAYVAKRSSELAAQ